MTLRARPIRQKDAFIYVGINHRHNGAPPGGMICTSVVDGYGILRGVGIAGRPSARAIDDYEAIEITRVCTDGTRNACSFLYGRLCRAAAAIGYGLAITYTLEGEDGASLKAAGFTPVASVEGRSWSCPSRPRQADLWGNETAPPGDKVRWERRLA